MKAYLIPQVPRGVPLGMTRSQSYYMIVDASSVPRSKSTNGEREEKKIRESGRGGTQRNDDVVGACGPRQSRVLYVPWGPNTDDLRLSLGDRMRRNSSQAANNKKQRRLHFPSPKYALLYFRLISEEGRPKEKGGRTDTSSTERMPISFHQGGK